MNGAFPSPDIVAQANQQKPAPQPIAPLSAEGAWFANAVADGAVDPDGLIQKGSSKGKRWYGPKANAWIKEHGGNPYKLSPEDNAMLMQIRSDEFDSFLSHPDAPKRRAGDFKDINALGKRYYDESKNYMGAGSNLSKLLASAKRESAAGDMALIFSIMKTLDPTSVVREGEQAQAQNATGVPEQIRNMYNRTLTGERLSPDQRMDFLKTGLALFDSEDRAQKNRDNYFTDLANTSGIDPRRIMYNPYSGLSKEANDYIASLVAAKSAQGQQAGGNAIPGVTAAPAQQPVSAQQAIPMASSRSPVQAQPAATPDFSKMSEEELLRMAGIGGQ